MRILHIISTINDNGGVQNVLYNYLSHMDNSVFSNDILVHGDKDSCLALKFINIGCRIHSISPRKKVGLRKYLKELKLFLKTMDYDILHIHLGLKSVFALHYSKMFKHRSKVIVHIHSNIVKESIIKKVVKKMLVSYIKMKSDCCFACGEKAASSFYGLSFFEKGKVFIMTNAISSNNYSFNSESRITIRRQLNIDNKTLVIGHVGTFYEPKNQLFLIDVFKELHKMNTNSKLVFVGGGKLEDTLRKHVLELDILDSVIFAGVKDNVSDYLSSFDYFLLPSLYEGVPMSLIEAQCSGLQSFASSNITREVNITGNVEYLDLTIGPKKWASAILSKGCLKERVGCLHKIATSKFDIDIAVSCLVEKYHSIIADENYKK